VNGLVPAYRFCPCCGGALDLRTLKTGDPPRLVCGRCDFIFYQDPKVASGVVLPYDGGIVLVRRAIEPRLGKWVFPGGYVDRGESVEAAAIREAREEAGLTVRLTRLLGVYSYPGNAVVLVAWAGEVTGGALQIDEESSEIRAFPSAALPWAEMAFPSTTAVLQDYLSLPR
jgi:8-oxo-dGTP diphosphatase